MAETGYNWSASAAMQKGGGAWAADNISHGTWEQGDAVNLDGKAACEIGVKIEEGDSDSVTGDVILAICGMVDGTNYEDYTQDVCWKRAVTPVSGDIVYVHQAIDPSHYSAFKLAIYNGAGASTDLDISVYIRTATIPAAS